MVDPRLTFYTFRSFYERSKFIREVYHTMSINEIYIYINIMFIREGLYRKRHVILFGNT